MPPALLATPMPWAEMASTGALAPATPAQVPRRLAATVAGSMGAIGAFSLMAAREGTRWAARLGHSWPPCRWSVALLSLPALGPRVLRW